MNAAVWYAGMMTLTAGAARAPFVGEAALGYERGTAIDELQPRLFKIGTVPAWAPPHVVMLDDDGDRDALKLFGIGRPIIDDDLQVSKFLPKHGIQSLADCAMLVSGDDGTDGELARRSHR